jgi:hypothetical protein
LQNRYPVVRPSYVFVLSRSPWTTPKTQLLPSLWKPKFTSLPTAEGGAIS